MQDRTRKPWLPREDLIARRMKNEGKTTAEIGSVLSRSPGAVESRFCWLQMDTEQRTKRNRRLRLAYRKRAPGARDHVLGHVQFMVPDADALAERDYRLSLAPRSLVAAVAGDPLPGFSALDRR